MLPFIQAGVGLGLQVLGGRSQRKAAQQAANEEAARIAREADEARNSLLLETDAINAQRTLVQDRLALADQAEQQAETEARAAIGPDVSLALPEQATARRQRRGKFFVQQASGVSI